MIQTSETIGEVSKSLVTFQATVEACKKKADNPFFKSKYADLPSIIAVIKPELKKCKLALIQSVEPTDAVGLLCRTRIIHESGEWIESTSYLTAEKNTPQGYGSATTYLRRYGLQAALGLSAEDDDGEQAEKPSRERPANRTPVKKVEKDTVSDAQLKMIYAKATAKGMPNEAAKELIYAVAGVESSKDILKADFDAVVEAIENWEAEQDNLPL